MSISSHWITGQSNSSQSTSTASIHNLNHLVCGIYANSELGCTVLQTLDIRLNSSHYSQLRDRLLSPIRIARNVVFHQSLNERFAAVFAEQVEQNGVYRLPQGSAVSLITGLLNVR